MLPLPKSRPGKVLPKGFSFLPRPISNTWLLPQGPTSFLDDRCMCYSPNSLTLTEDHNRANTSDYTPINWTWLQEGPGHSCGAKGLPGAPWGPSCKEHMVQWRPSLGIYRWASVFCGFRFVGEPGSEVLSSQPSHSATVYTMIYPVESHDSQWALLNWGSGPPLYFWLPVISQMAHIDGGMCHSSGKMWFLAQEVRPSTLVLSREKMPNFLKCAQKWSHDLTSTNKTSPWETGVQNEAWEEMCWLIVQVPLH